jgi:membrane-anchored protein YejM (alkaline phosphatase superfamily)
MYPMLPMSLWVVHSWLCIRFSLTFIYYLQSVLCHVPVVASVSGLSILDCSFGFL